MLKEPVHRDIRIRIPRRQQSPLASNFRKSHSHQLCHRFGVEYRSSNCICSQDQIVITKGEEKRLTIGRFGQFDFGIQFPFRDEAIERKKILRHEERDVDFLRDPVDELESTSLHGQDLRKRSEFRRSVSFRQFVAIGKRGGTDW